MNGKPYIITMIHLTLEDRKGRVLALDTGLEEREFARMRALERLREPGFLIAPAAGMEPGGQVGEWRIEGAVPQPSAVSCPSGSPRDQGEYPAAPETLWVYGPDFEGESLEVLVNGPGREDEALRGILSWVKARNTLVRAEAGRTPGKGRDAPGDSADSGGLGIPGPWPGGALIGAGGAVLLLPPGLADLFPAGARLEGLYRWVHPGLAGEEADLFCAGALLYRVLSGEVPFPGENPDAVRERIRQGFCLPPELACPGLVPEGAAILREGLRLGGSGRPGQAGGVPRGSRGGGPERNGDGVREKVWKEAPPLGMNLEEMLAAHPHKEAWFGPVDERRRAAIGRERGEWERRVTGKVKRGDFLRRRGTMLAAAAAVLVLTGLIGGSILQSRAALPTTKGMTAEEVIRAWYGAFGSLDHQLMEACVTGGAGKGEIGMVTNFFVINRVRQGYEGAKMAALNAEEWLEEGQPRTERPVFGVTGLSLRVISLGAEEGWFEATYTLWIPGDMQESLGAEESALPSPRPLRRREDLMVVKRRGLWQIGEIRRDE